MSNDLSQYEGKKIIVVKKDGENAVELEGTAQTANEVGILLKPKGKATVDIVSAEDIVEVRYVVEKPKALTRKTLKVVEFGQARNHLLERHGYTLARINEMDEQEALNEHSRINHEAADLGHVHGDKSETPRAQAVNEESSAEGSGD